MAPRPQVMMSRKDRLKTFSFLRAINFSALKNSKSGEDIAF
jgi:hypothetical protein